MMRILVACGCLLLTSTTVLAQDKLLPADRTIEQAVDHYIDAKLKTKGITPAPPAERCRHPAALDARSQWPGADVERRWTNTSSSSDPDKKTKLVDRLLASPAFSRHGAQTFFAFMQYADGTAAQGGLRDPVRLFAGQLQREPRLGSHVQGHHAARREGRQEGRGSGIPQDARQGPQSAHHRRRRAPSSASTSAVPSATIIRTFSSGRRISSTA